MIYSFTSFGKAIGVALNKGRRVNNQLPPFVFINLNAEFGGVVGKVLMKRKILVLTSLMLCSLLSLGKINLPKDRRFIGKLGSLEYILTIKSSNQYTLEAIYNGDLKGGVRNYQIEGNFLVDDESVKHEIRNNGQEILYKFPDIDKTILFTRVNSKSDIISNQYNNESEKYKKFNYNSINPSSARAAYLSDNIIALVDIIERGDSESDIATQYLVLSDLQDLSFKDLSYIYKRIPENNKIKNYIVSLLHEEEIEILEKLENYGGNDIMDLLKSNPEYEGIIKKYAEGLNEGLDSLSYNETRYLINKLPIFNRQRLSTINEKKRYQIEKKLSDHVKDFTASEGLAMDMFIATIKYELFEGLIEQFNKFAEAYSYDQDLETINRNAIYNSFINLMSNFWNEEIVYQFLNIQVDKFSQSINEARKTYLSNMDMNYPKNFVITIPTDKINFSGGMDNSDFYWISQLREDLADSKAGAYIISGLFNILTGASFLGNLGESLYNSSKGVEEAEKEVHYRKNALTKAYATMIERTQKVIDNVSKNIKDQQIKQSKEFNDYVIKNY